MNCHVYAWSRSIWFVSWKPVHKALSACLHTTCDVSCHASALALLSLHSPCPLMQVCPNSWHFCKDGIHVQTAIASLPFPLCQHVSSVPQSSRHIVHALLSCAEIPAADDVPSPTAQQTRCTTFWHRPHAIHCIWSPFSPHLPQLHPLPLCLQPLSTGFYVTLVLGHSMVNTQSAVYVLAWGIEEPLHLTFGAQ